MTPSATHPSPTPATSMLFARAARLLGGEARERGLVVPGFRSPPRVVGVHRTLRRHGGGVTIAVQVRDRPWPAVLADMIEGVVVANDRTTPHADRLRAELWQSVSDAGLVADAPATAGRAEAHPPARQAKVA